MTAVQANHFSRQNSCSWCFVVLRNDKLCCPSTLPGWCHVRRKVKWMGISCTLRRLVFPQFWSSLIEKWDGTNWKWINIRHWKIDGNTNSEIPAIITTFFLLTSFYGFRTWRIQVHKKRFLKREGYTHGNQSWLNF